MNCEIMSDTYVNHIKLCKLEKNFTLRHVARKLPVSSGGSFLRITDDMQQRGKRGNRGENKKPDNAVSGVQ